MSRRSPRVVVRLHQSGHEEERVELLCSQERGAGQPEWLP